MKFPILFRGFALVLAVLGGLTQAACGGGTTVFVSSWRLPGAEPLAMKGEPMAAVVMMTDDATRRNAEDVLAREITHYGARGIPMYQIMPGPALGNEAAARAAVEQAGVKGVVVMRPMGTKTKTETQQTYSSPSYSGYWGGYYPYGWGSAWGPSLNTFHNPVNAAPTPYVTAPGSVETTKTTTEVVEVEVLVYSLKQNVLVWAGKSESTEPGKVDEFVTRLAAEVVKELRNTRLLAN
jgi:hypothetical protein